MIAIVLTLIGFALLWLVIYLTRGGAAATDPTSGEHCMHEPDADFAPRRCCRCGFTQRMQMLMEPLPGHGPHVVQGRWAWQPPLPPTCTPKET